MITVRKLKVFCENKEFYDFLKIEQREQVKALNMCVSILHTSNIVHNIDSGAEERINKSITKIKANIEKLEKQLENKKNTDKKREEITKAIETNKKILEGELKILEEGKEQRKGLDKQYIETYIKNNNMYHVLSNQTQIQHMRTIDLVTQKVSKDYSNNFKEIITGECSLMNYKKTFPLMIDNKSIKIVNDGEDYYIKIMKGYELKIVLGRKVNENTIELRKTLDKCISGEYDVRQSSVGFDKNHNVIFNLSIDIPIENKYKPVENRSLGVDLGMAVPVYMCVDSDTYKKKSLGSINNFLRVKEQMQERRRKLQKDLTLTNGGKGRKKKLQLLDKLKENESNFCKTYNHKLSKEIVKFAKTNKCEFIKMEKLTKDGFPNSVLRNWSYFQLQTMVEYKAKREGIKVLYVNPAYTSQTCSKCGHTDKENRPKGEKGQAYFKCTCCGFEINADHNASINIARSIDIV